MVPCYPFTFILKGYFTGTGAIILPSASESTLKNTDIEIYLYTTTTGIIFCMRPANERRRYNVTSSLIGWAHSQNDPCHNKTQHNENYMLVSHMKIFWWFQS